MQTMRRTGAGPWSQDRKALRAAIAGALVGSLLMGTGCTTTTYQIAAYSQRQGQTMYVATDDVEVYGVDEPPDRPFRVIGTIEVAGGPHAERDELMAMALERAKGLGAHAVVNVEYLRGTPKYVVGHKKEKFSAGKTIVAVLAGALLIGLVVLAVVAGPSGSNEGEEEDPDDSAYDALADSDQGGSASAGSASIVRAQAVRFVSGEDQGADPGQGEQVLANNAEADQRWLGTVLGPYAARIAGCLAEFSDDSHSEVAMLLDLDISAAGRVLDVRPQKASVDASFVSGCVEASLLGAELGSPPGGHRFSVAIPLRIQNPGEGRGSPLAEGAPQANRPQSPPTLFVVGFASDEEHRQLATMATELLTVALYETSRFSVHTRADIEARLTLEQTKDMAGCTDSVCLEEITGALGADWVCHGVIASTGSERSISATVTSKSGKTLARSVVLDDLSGPIEISVQTLVNDLVLQLRAAR